MSFADSAGEMKPSGLLRHRATSSLLDIAIVQIVRGGVERQLAVAPLNLGITSRVRACGAGEALNVLTNQPALVARNAQDRGSRVTT